MTDTSPTRPLEVDASRPLEPAAVALLQSVGAACAQLDAAFVVAGATARDILMWHVHGIRPVRATRDVDVAVCAVSWPFHARLVDTLVATGQFARAPKHRQKLLFDSGTQGFRTELDLVPFGPLEAPPGEIAWPPGGDFVLNVLGFQEAVDTALTVSIGAGITVPVASLPALALLKLLAWKDRRARQNSDAYDLLFLLTHFHDAGNRERIWDVAPDLLERHGFQPELVQRRCSRVTRSAPRRRIRAMRSARCCPTKRLTRRSGRICRPARSRSCQVNSMTMPTGISMRSAMASSRIRPFVGHDMLPRDGNTVVHSPRHAEAAQSSSGNPATRLNSRPLFVTSTAPAAIAWPAIEASFAPIGVSRAARSARIAVVASIAAVSHDSTPSSRATKLVTSSACFGDAFLPTAPNRISA